MDKVNQWANPVFFRLGTVSPQSICNIFFSAATAKKLAVRYLDRHISSLFLSPEELQRLIELTKAGKSFGTSGRGHGFSPSTGKSFPALKRWADKGAKGLDSSSVVSEFW